MSMISISNLRVGVLTAVALVSPAFSMHAQDRGAPVKVNVPFDFESGSRRFKAGTYTISSLNQHLALVRGMSTSGMALMQETQDVGPAQTGKVVFHRYGDRYFISDIFIRGHMNHVHVLESKDEKQTRRSVEEGQRMNRTVAILELP